MELMIGMLRNLSKLLDYEFNQLIFSLNIRVKIFILRILIIILPFNVFAVCTDQERVEMLNAGVSSEYIKSFCELDIETEVEEKNQVAIPQPKRGLLRKTRKRLNRIE